VINRVRTYHFLYFFAPAKKYPRLRDAVGQEKTVGRFRWALIELLGYCGEQHWGIDQRFSPMLIISSFLAIS
jgi:hypothetical protein